MSVSVGAVLAKAAVTVATDKKLRKAVAGIILGIIIMILAPIALMVSVFEAGAAIDYSSPEIQRLIINNMSAEEKAKLQALETAMKTIERKMVEAGFGSRVREAQVLYVCALYEIQKTDENFYEKLVGCFSEGQTDAQLIQNINRTFGLSISLDEFRKIMSLVKNTYIDTSKYGNPSVKNNVDLVIWAENAYEAKWGYVWGTYGNVLTKALLASKISQYPDEVGSKEQYIRANWLNGRTADCIGLIKGYGWLDVETGQINYASNGMPDLGANGMHDVATEKGPMSTMPDTVGLAVWMPGHIGIYIGNGEVIEAQSTHNGVRKTRLEGRGWHAWLKIPFISYEETDGAAEESQP